MKHSWTVKPRKWERYGTYIYKEYKCECGCIKRIVITDDGYENIESYTLNEHVTSKAGECIRTDVKLLKHK